MANKYLIVVKSDSGGIDTGHLVKRLQALFPTLVDLGEDQFGDREWSLVATDQAWVHGSIDADGDGLELEGPLDTVAALAVAIRGLIPRDVELEVCDEEYTWSLELTPQTSVAQLARME